MDVGESYSPGWCFVVLLDDWVLCSMLLFLFQEGVNEMFWVVVLLEGFVEILEFIFLAFCCTTMGVGAVEKGSKAAKLVLCRVITVVV